MSRKWLHAAHIKPTAMTEEEASILDRLHSCIFFLLEAAEREVDGGSGVRGRQELVGSRDGTLIGKKGKSRRGLSSSQHGSNSAQGRRNVRTNKSPSMRQEISLRSDASFLGSSRAPDIDSWSDFPPMGTQNQSPTPEPAPR